MSAKILINFVNGYSLEVSVSYGDGELVREGLKSGIERVQFIKETFVRDVQETYEYKPRN